MSDELVLPAGFLGRIHNRTREEIRDEVARLYALRHQIVFRSLAAYTRDPATAEELTQEAFFRLYQHFLAGHSVENAISWTSAVARNLAVDRLRGSKQEQVLSEESWLMLVETHAGSEDSFEQVLIERETRERLLALIDVLPTPQRDCVQLYAKGANFKEIAESLKIPYHQALLLTRGGLQRIKRLAARNKS